MCRQNGHTDFVKYNAEMACKQNENFKKWRDKHRRSQYGFVDMATELMTEHHWNSITFKEKTLLDDVTYSRIKNKKPKNWKFQTIISVCFGLGTDLNTAAAMLQSEGYAFGKSPEHLAYAFVLDAMRGDSIDDCNAFLASINVPMLGNQRRKDF
ncbi:hypothetical protein FACS189499_06130 [Clostridia bacterium]|nr:hypothetical protein FACS189499_06130 [Clostridia bacterium]